MSDQFAGIDFSQYSTWPTITAPTGAVYYKVPGTGYVYDPFLSAAKGKPVLWTNPQPAVDDKNKAQAEHDAQVRQQEQAQSPLGQAAPIIGATAGTVGGAYAVHALTSGSTVGGVIPGVGGAPPTIVMQNGTIAGGGVPTASVPATSVAPHPFTAAATATNTGADASGATAIGQNADGTLIMSDGSASVPTSGAAESGVGFLAQAPGTTLLGSESLGAALPAAGYAAGAYTGFQQGKGVLDAIHQKPLDWQERAALALPTFGVSLFSNYIPGLTHKTTKQYEQGRWSGLADKGVTDAPAAAAANHPDGDTGVWQNGQFAGKKWNFDDAQTMAKQDPAQFRLVLANYQAFGNDWSSYTPQQQDAIVSEALNQGLYKPDHGDIIATDVDKFRTIKDKVLSGTQSGTAVTPAVAQSTQGVTTFGVPKLPGASLPPGFTATVTSAARSQTKSPGIGLDGNPIVYRQLGEQLAARMNARGR